MVGDPLHLIEGNFSGTQIQSTVNLPGVGRDDLPVAVSGQLHPQTALTAGSRAENHDQLGQGHGHASFFKLHGLYHKIAAASIPKAACHRGEFGIKWDRRK